MSLITLPGGPLFEGRKNSNGPGESRHGINNGSDQRNLGFIPASIGPAGIGQFRNRVMPPVNAFR